MAKEAAEIVGLSDSMKARRALEDRVPLSVVMGEQFRTDTRTTDALARRVPLPASCIGAGVSPGDRFGRRAVSVDRLRLDCGLETGSAAVLLNAIKQSRHHCPDKGDCESPREGM